MTTHRPPTPQTLRQFKARLQHLVENGELQPATADVYVRDARQFIQMLGERDIHPTRATKEHVNAYLVELVEGYAPASVNRKVSSIRRYFDFLKDQGWIRIPPTSNLELPRSRPAQQRRLSPATAVKILKVVDLTTVKGLRDFAILNLITAHGLRVHQLHELDVDDVDLNCGMHGAIFVDRTSHKPIFITQQTHIALKAWLSARRLHRPTTRALFVSVHRSNGRSESNRRLSKRGIRLAIDHYLEKVGAKTAGRSCDALRFVLK
jgi:integrase/recombinase XerD